MVLIDTSSWVEALRAGGRVDVRERVQGLLAAGDAAWCELVMVELWNGARGDAEKRALRHFEQLVINLPIDDLVWKVAIQLAQTARGNGITVPTTDLVIAACARRYGVAIEHVDRHLAAIISI